MTALDPVPLTKKTFARALRHLCNKDPDLAHLPAVLDLPVFWTRKPGFASLIHIILEQQVSLASARASFDRLRKGAWKEHDLLRIIDQVDAIEVFNARCMFAADNHKALQFAQKHKLLGTVGSDSHTRREYGTALTLMPPFEDTAEGFLAALQDAEYDNKLSSWLVHFGSKFSKWSKKLGLKPRMWDGG